MTKKPTIYSWRHLTHYLSLVLLTINSLLCMEEYPQNWRQ